MENELVSYELSSTLKELGFNHPCFGYYDCERDFKFVPNKTKFLECEIDRPTFSQAFRWFREEHDLRVRNYVHGNMSGGISEYFVIFKFIDNTNETICEVGALTYEKAEIACLKKLIEIVKKKPEIACLKKLIELIKK